MYILKGEDRTMFHIAICDDEEYFSVHIKKYVEEYLTSKELEFEIDVYNSGKELLENKIEIEKYSIIFLDINMSEIDGIVTAQKIREFSSEIFIVFVTAYINFSLDGYKVNATRYILKNNDNFKENIFECMYTILEKMKCIVLKKTFRFNELEKTVLLDKLIYVESKKHILQFHVMENQLEIYTMRGTLNELEDELARLGFLRIHQSFLVNLKHIKNMKRYKVILDNDKELIIPKPRYKEVKNLFIAYKGEM